MSLGNAKIEHVSDTALWVAHYRATESERSDALFNDRLASVLVGERGKKIAETMQTTARYTRWSVVIRTCVIDALLQELAQAGTDLVVNLGAGLDTRPYRLALPKQLQWVEVDYPDMIAHKEKLLAREEPRVQLERISLDLADEQKRRDLFAQLATRGKKIVILTEGVLPYLSEEQVASLAMDLRAQKNFQFWIAEYFSSEIYRYFNTKERMSQMQNAPFRFFPADWFEFFKRNGWKAQTIRYLAEESRKLARPMPIPWWAYFLVPFMSRERAQHYQRQMGYVVFTPIE